MQVLIIDADPTLRELLAEQLRRDDEFRVFTAVDVEEGLRMAGENADAALLDATLCGPSAAAFINNIRALRADDPPAVLLLLPPKETAAETDCDLPPGDYMTKPLKLAEILRWLRKNGRRRITIGRWNFHQADRKLIGDGGAPTLSLTEKEAAILTSLYRAGGDGLTREALLGKVWGYGSGISTHTLETHIYRLRQKIARAPGCGGLLRTLPGGYALGPAETATAEKAEATPDK